MVWRSLLAISFGMRGLAKLKPMRATKKRKKRYLVIILIRIWQLAISSKHDSPSSMKLISQAVPDSCLNFHPVLIGFRNKWTKTCPDRFRYGTSIWNSLWISMFNIQNLVIEVQQRPGRRRYSEGTWLQAFSIHIIRNGLVLVESFVYLCTWSVSSTRYCSMAEQKQRKKSINLRMIRCKALRSEGQKKGNLKNEKWKMKNERLTFWLRSLI